MGGSWLNVSHQPGGREFKRDLLRGLPRRYFMHVPPIVMTGLLIILHMIYTKYMYVLGCTTLEWWGKPPAKKEEVGVQLRRLAMGSVSWRYPWRKGTISELAVGGLNFGRMAAVGAVR